MRILMAAMTACLLAAGPARAGQMQGIGAGVVVGDPVGGTFRGFLSGSRSLDFGVGFSGDTALWADYAWHAWDLFPPVKSGRLEGWVSAGPRIEAAPETEFGVRTMLGASYWVAGRPIELFATAGPVFRMTPTGGVEADGGIGVRFYFGALPK